MSIATITNKVANAAKIARYKAIGFVKVNEPKLWMIGGGICIVAGTVMACKAARKLDDILEERDYDLVAAEEIHEELVSAIESGASEVTTKEADNALIADKAKAHLRAIGTTVKEFLPAIALNVAGGLMIAKGYLVLDTRAGEAIAAYAALDEAFREYRQRVVEDQGADADYKYATGMEPTEMEKTLIDWDESIPPFDFANSEFTFHFNPMTSGLYSPWDTGDDRCHENLAQFKRCKEQMDARIDGRGHAFVNEVLDWLDMERTPAGALCGWISSLFPNEGDGEVFFDIKDSLVYFPDAPQGPGYYRDYVFTLNPDHGVIWDKIYTTK